MAPSLMHEQRPPYVSTATDTPIARTNGSLLGVLIAFIAILLILGGWLLHRWRKLPWTRRVPSTPELAIQDYKGPMTADDSFLSYHVSYPSLAQPSPAHTAGRFYDGGDGFPSMAMQPISSNQYETIRYTVTPSIALPAPATTRLSLNLPEEMSLSSEIESLVNVPIMSASALRKGDSTVGTIQTERPTTPMPRQMRLSQAELVRALASGTLRDHLPPPRAPKPGHITSFTLPPIIGSPVLSSSQDLKAWCRPISLGKLMEELHLDFASGAGYEGTAVEVYPTTRDMLPISISEGDVDLAFKRFSVLAFQGSMATISSAQESPKVSDFQFKMDPFPIQSVRARSATVTTPVSPRHRPTHHGQYRPWVTKSVSGTIGPSYSLPPWEKVALLSQCLPDLLRGDAGVDKGDKNVTANIPLSIEQPPTLPLIEREAGTPNTPEFFFRGLRSETFDSPVIPSSFGTPLTDTPCEDLNTTPKQTNRPDMGKPTIASPLSLKSSTLVLDTSDEQTPQRIGSPLTLSPQSLGAYSLDFLSQTPRTPFRADLAASSSHSIDEFTHELLHLVQNGRFSAHGEGEGITPTASECSLSRALAGIGLNFVQTPSASETSLARWRLSLTGSVSAAVAAKRYIASRLSQHLERSDLDWSEEEGDMSVCAVDALVTVQEAEISPESGMDDATMILPCCATSVEPELEASLVLAEESSRAQVTSDDEDIPGQEDVSRDSVTALPSDAAVLSLTNSEADDPLSDEGPFDPEATTPTYLDLCPPLVVVTSPTLAMCFQRFGIDIDLALVGGEGGDPVHESDSEYGSDTDDSSSGSEFEFDRTYSLVRKKKVGEDTLTADDVHVPATSIPFDPAPSSSTSTSSASSTYLSHSLSTSSTSSISTTSSSKIPIPISSRSTARILASPVIDFTDGGKHSVQVVHRPQRYPDAEQQRKFADFAHFTSTVIRRHRDRTMVAATGIPVLQRRKSQATATDDPVAASASQACTAESADGAANSPSLFGDDSDRWLEKSDFGGCLMDETFPGGDSNLSLQTSSI